MRVISHFPRCPIKAAALTFDDGAVPEALMRMIPMLETHDSRATFFWNGMDDYSFRTVRAYGHEVGSHGRRHLHPGDFQDGELQRDLQWSSAALKHPDLYRPPYGEDPMRMARLAANVGMDTTVMWSIDTHDYKQDGTAVERVLEDIQPGAIILGHEQYAPAYLDELLSALRKSGYRLVTVSQLALLSEQPPTKD